LLPLVTSNNDETCAYGVLGVSPPPARAKTDAMIGEATLVPP
jgi:hypothetical protein